MIEITKLKKMMRCDRYDRNYLKHMGYSRHDDWNHLKLNEGMGYYHNDKNHQIEGRNGMWSPWPKSPKTYEIWSQWPKPPKKYEMQL